MSKENELFKSMTISKAVWTLALPTIMAMLFGGFTMGVQPLLAYSYGAKDSERLKGLIPYTLTASVIMGLTIARQGFVFIPALFIGNAAFGLTGLIWAQPIADIISVIIASLRLRRNIREMEKEFEIEKTPELIRAYA